jgi:23S rRNA pseudouridine1911/1915/1917 synthase
MTIEILHEDNHCLVVNKPAGLLTQGDATGDESLVSLAKRYLKDRYQKPGNVFVGLVHRLDRPTSGVVVLAKTSKGASRLSEQFRAGTVRKTYWAVVDGEPDPPVGEWIDRLEKDRGLNRVHILDEESDDDHAGQEARVAYRRLRKVGRGTLVELRPMTGRGHQLRVQLASRGMPIAGDRKYGSKFRVAASDGGLRILLHAKEIVFTHPTTREAISIVAPLPADWPSEL